MLTKVVAIEQGLGDTGAFAAKGEGVVGHFGYGFEDYGVVGGIVRVASPGEGGVAVNETCRDGERVDFVLVEVVDDGYSRFVDVAAVDGFVGERLGAGDGPVKVVGVGGAQGGNGETGLGEAGGELRVSMNDGSDGGELTVEESVGIEVGGGLEVAVDYFALEIGDDHVFGAEVVVVDAGGLDDDEVLVAVDAAGVAEGVEHEASADKFEVGFKDGSAKFFKKHGFSGFRFRVNVFLAGRLR